MASYIVMLIKKSGNHEEKVKEYKAKTLILARAWSYQMLSHNKENKKGDMECRVYKKKDLMAYLTGEVMNTVYDIRYWYPYKGGKYKLKSNGTLGKKLR